MTTVEALAGLGSLAQQTRLEAFRLLVQRGPEGLSAGTIAEALDVPASSLSFHLQQLMHAALVTQKRRSRQLIYAANFDQMNALVAFLTENCCGGVTCRPAESARCAPPGRAATARAASRGRR